MVSNTVPVNCKDYLEQIRIKAGTGSSIVFVPGNFNILHPGHLRLLRFAAESGDCLVVGVTSDDFPDTLLPEAIRLEAIQETTWVDHAFIMRDPSAQIVEWLRPEIVVKGKEHEGRDNPETAVLQKYGGRLAFCSGDIGFSSFDLLRKQIKEVSATGIHIPSNFLERHGSGLHRLPTLFESFTSVKVCVIGDTIIDEYIDCEALGMSQEDPTIVVSPLMRETFVGGAAIVAAHAKRLGAEVSFFSVLGQDEPASFVRQRLMQEGVKATFYVEPERPTTLKQRFRAAGKTLLRVNHLRQHAISNETSQRMLKDLQECIEGCDVVIFSDFSYGCLPQSMVDVLTRHCTDKGIAMVADSQSSSQIGDVSRFMGMKLITPTEREARIALKDYDSGLAVLAQNLCHKCNAQNVVITLGAEGILMYSAEAGSSIFHTDKLPALNSSPKDVAGAGDSLLTAAALTLIAGGSLWESAFLGSLAAACQVSRTGNIPVSIEDLRQGLKYGFK